MVPLSDIFKRNRKFWDDTLNFEVLRVLFDDIVGSTKSFKLIINFMLNNAGQFQVSKGPIPLEISIFK